MLYKLGDIFICSSSGSGGGCQPSNAAVNLAITVFVALVIAAAMYSATSFSSGLMKALRRSQTSFSSSSSSNSSKSPSSWIHLRSVVFVVASSSPASCSSSDREWMRVSDQRKKYRKAVRGESSRAIGTRICTSTWRSWIASSCIGIGWWWCCSRGRDHVFMAEGPTHRGSAIAASVLQRRKQIIDKYSSIRDMAAGQLHVSKLLDDAHDLFVVSVHHKIETTSSPSSSSSSSSSFHHK